MNLLGKKKIYWFIFSSFVIFLGILSLIFWGLRWGLDFRGGTLYEIRPKSSETKIQINEVRDYLKGLNLPGLVVTQTSENSILIKTAPIEEEKVIELKEKLKEKIGELEELRYEIVGPVIGADLRKKAIWAVILACLLIIFYIAYAFKNFRFGIAAILALVHDLLVTVGIFSIAAHFWSYEVDSYFIVALLTILGFSVHDTIVVFDRLRENLKRYPGYDFEEVANESIIQTINRSINTSLTVLITLLSLFILGGESLKPFVFALITGIIAGTYSSIFIATPILVIWERRKK